MWKSEKNVLPFWKKIGKCGVTFLPTDWGENEFLWSKNGNENKKFVKNIRKATLMKWKQNMNKVRKTN